MSDEQDKDKKKILSFFCTKPCSSPACFLIVTTAGEPQANRIRDHCLVKLVCPGVQRIRIYVFEEQTNGCLPPGLQRSVQQETSV